MPIGIQPWHIIVVAIVAVLVFGPNLFVAAGRGINKSITAIGKGTRGMLKGFRDEVKGQQPSSASIQPRIFSSIDPQPTSDQFCAQCGSRNPMTAKFCNACGGHLYS